jgi:alpha-mannosidase
VPASRSSGSAWHSRTDPTTTGCAGTCRPRPADVSHAHGGFAVVERGLHPEGGYNEEPLATYPAHGWVDAGGIAILLDHVAEYELVPGSAGRPDELALTVLRAVGLVSRNDHRYREDPAGPQIAIPAAQLRGPWGFGFAILPHAGTWHEVDVARAAEAYRHDLLAVLGSGPREAAQPSPADDRRGLELIGDGVVLSSLRRRGGGWLEARLVNLGERPAEAVIRHVTDAVEADLLGRPGSPLDVADGELRLRLGAAEIRTVRLRRVETAIASPDILDAAGPRQNA